MRSAPLQLDKVEARRQSRGLTVEDLAGKVGIDVRNVRRWLSGKRVLLKNIDRLAAVLGTTSGAIRADAPAAPLLAKPEKPCRFVIQIRLKGYLSSDRQKDHLVCLTQEVVQSLAREGIAVTGQKSVWAASRFAGPAAWRILVGVPAMTDDRPSWAIAAIIPARVAAFAESRELNSDQFSHGELLARGWGRRVPRATLRRITRLWGRDESAVLDLTVECADAC